VYAIAPTVEELMAIVPERLDPGVIKDANRRLFTPHGKAFGEYVWRTEDWTCGALMVGVPEGMVEFRPAARGASYGRLSLPDEVQVGMVLFDGQHRRYGIQQVLDAEEAVATALERAGEDDAANEKRQRIATILADTIPVQIYEEDSIEALRQMFADISNVRPPDPITVARFDQRSPFNVAASRLANDHPLLIGRVEMERNTLTSKSTNVFTLNQLGAVLRVLYSGVSGRVNVKDTGADVSPDVIYQRGHDFLDDMLAASSDLREIVEGETTPLDVRERGVLTVNVTILKILAGIWRELVINKGQSRDEVARFFGELPQLPAAEQNVWTRAGVLPPQAERATPLARSQEMRKAVTEGVMEYAAA
jgi:DGQHR domain-containing protein